jgi:small-conductance mechanosensitive channel
LVRKDIVKAVNSVYKDREKLVRNMKDRQSVAGVLSKIIAVILFLVAVIIFITLLGVDFVSFIAPFGTAVLAISFVFGSAAASAFKSFVFLIFVNPFDVGDRVRLEDNRVLKILKISLLSTTCESPGSLKIHPTFVFVLVLTLVFGS